MPLAARLAELLGVPGPLPEAADKARALNFTQKDSEEDKEEKEKRREKREVFSSSSFLSFSLCSFDGREARDKAATRMALRQNGLPTPPVYEIR